MPPVEAALRGDTNGEGMRVEPGRPRFARSPRNAAVDAGAAVDAAAIVGRRPGECMGGVADEARDWVVSWAEENRLVGDTVPEGWGMELVGR